MVHEWSIAADLIGTHIPKGAFVDSVATASAILVSRSTAWTQIPNTDTEQTSPVQARHEMVHYFTLARKLWTSGAQMAVPSVLPASPWPSRPKAPTGLKVALPPAAS